jgi:hypothetical protein
MQRLPQKAFGLVLREHQRVRVGGGQLLEGHREQTAVAVVHTEAGNYDATAQHLVDEAQGLQGFERPRVDNGRAGMFRRSRSAVENNGPDPKRGQHRRRREPGRPGPYHDDLDLLGYRPDASTIVTVCELVFVHRSLTFPCQLHAG